MTALSRSERTGTRNSFEAIPWVTDGVIAGFVGSAVVAVFFLVRDIAVGWPLWTPSALGAAFFRGEVAEALPYPEVALVAGYSLLHGVIFVSIGLLASFAVETNRHLAEHHVQTAIWTSVGLFLAFELMFVGLAATFSPGLIGLLGAGYVSAANLLAAIAMAVFLSKRAHDRPIAEEPQKPE